MIKRDVSEVPGENDEMSSGRRTSADPFPPDGVFSLEGSVFGKFIECCSAWHCKLYF